MKPELKSFLMNVVPPVMLSGIRVLSGHRSRWTGNYRNWHEAVAASSGYDAQAIFDRVQMAARAVRDGTASWERDSTCFYQDDYNWQLLACLMTVAARARGKLHVLDFGGALGSTYMQHRKVLSKLDTCTWSVVEQPHVVQCGQAEFKNEALGFFNDIGQCFKSRPINVVLFSSVLQYLEHPFEIIDQVLGLAPMAVIIDRTPVAKIGERITIQHVPKSIYPATYPCRLLDRSQLQNSLGKRRTLTPWFNSTIDPPGFVGVMSMADDE